MIKQAIVKPGVTPAIDSSKKAARIVNNEPATRNSRPRDIRDIRPPLDNDKAQVPQ